MSALGDLLRGCTDLDEAEIGHLHRLVGEWQALADLSFADLLMFVHDDRSDPGRPQWRCVAQMRPSTSTTLYDEDMVAAALPLGERDPLDTAWRTGSIVAAGEPVWREDVAVREEAIPVRCAPGTRVLAVIARDTDVQALRTPSQLEIAYMACAADLAQMVVEGSFPFPESADTAAEAPRVGDGMLRLGVDGVVLFASPNAQSGLRRIGFSANVVGMDFVRLVRTLDLAVDVSAQRPDAALKDATQGGIPTETELSARRGDVAVRIRALPLAYADARAGTLMLLRDVTEVRRRDRALTTKDATIREIHHRVKNNLQTVAALLRMQGRRSSIPEARAALDESVRRVTSIAVVHETLSQTLDETVSFDAIADVIASMSIDLATAVDAVELSGREAPSHDGAGLDAGEGGAGPDGAGREGASQGGAGHQGRASLTRAGSFGHLPAEVATPLALVLSELVSNAVEHGYGGGGGPLELRVTRGPDGVEVILADEGAGLPEPFVLERAGLGLQIVRTLVVSELRGTFTMRRRSGPGTEAVVAVPAEML